MVAALSQEQAAAYLRDTHGIDLQPSTLKAKRTHGGGPRYFRVKRSPLYTTEALDEYAHKLVTTAFSSTADERAAR